MNKIKNNYENSSFDDEGKEPQLSPSEQFLADMNRFQALSESERNDFLHQYDTDRGWIPEAAQEQGPSESQIRLATTAIKAAESSSEEKENNADGAKETLRKELLEFLSSNEIDIARLPISAEFWSTKPPKAGQSLGNQNATLNNKLKATESQPDKFLLNTTAIREEGVGLKVSKELANKGAAETIATMPAVCTLPNILVEKQVEEKLAFGRKRVKTVTERSDVAVSRTMGDYLDNGDNTPAWLVGYQAYTLSSLVNGSHRVGEPYIMQVAMPEHQAHALTEWLRDNPLRARELTEYTLTDVLGRTDRDAPKVTFTDRIRTVRFTDNPRNELKSSELVSIDS